MRIVYDEIKLDAELRDVLLQSFDDVQQDKPIDSCIADLFDYIVTLYEEEEEEDEDE